MAIVDSLLVGPLATEPFLAGEWRLVAIALSVTGPSTRHKADQQQWDEQSLA
jgi:hypothetical protein